MWELHNFNPDDFLQSVWQQQPRLYRQALPGFTSPISPEELAGLACEQGVHSRLVMEQDDGREWLLSYGPFTEDTFLGLPATHYSLLVSECEKWIPELRELVQLFEFIPKWRLDDLMISYAPDFGSVGPHIDDYDVFLIQAAGQRKWSIMDEFQDDPGILPEQDLAIMSDFQCDREWILEPGDMLYLPPRIAHHGVAMGDGCMTYSVGFRAVTRGQIMDQVMLQADNNNLTGIRYADGTLDTSRDSAEITSAEIQRFMQMLQDMMSELASDQAEIVGRLVSAATLADDIQIMSCNSVTEVQQYAWQMHPDSRCYYHRSEQQLLLFHNGHCETLTNNRSNEILCQQLCHPEDAQFSKLITDLPAALVLKLVNSGTWIPRDE